MDSAYVPALDGGATVLVVDDDPRVLNIVAIMLAARGYRVLKSGGPEDAIGIFKKQCAEIDMLLSDVMMPGMSGPELNARLSELKPNLPVLFMTGYTEPGAASTNYLKKPFRMDDLLQRVAETLGHGNGSSSGSNEPRN